MLQEINVNIPITFVVVTKRQCVDAHSLFRNSQLLSHVKFLPSNPSNRDRTGNTPTGTLVDTTIVAPNRPNFYLVGR